MDISRDGGPLRSICLLFSIAVDQKALIWSLGMVVSMSSSKYILVDLGLHYPLHLHLLQLIATAALGVLRLSLCTARSSILTTGLTRMNVLDLVWPGLAATSSILLLQAILHFSNLATLAMLPIIGLFAEQISASAIAATRPILSTTIPLGLCCIALLYNEYRLMVIGLACALPAVLLAGLSRSILQHTTLSRRPAHDNPVCFVLLCLYGLVITSCCLVVKEGHIPRWDTYSPTLICLVLLNMASSAVSLHIGMSMLLPLGHYKANELLWALLLLSGGVGCISSSLLQRSFSTVFQILTYGVAILVASNIWCQVISWWEDERPYRSVSSTPIEDVAALVTEDELRLKGNTTRLPWLCGMSVPKCAPFATILVVWCGFIFLNYSYSTHTDLSRLAPSLDSTFQANTSAEIVVSMYEEPLEEISLLIALLHQVPALSRAHVHIYTKGSRPELETIKEYTGAQKVTRLPNIGREGETYLHHILTNWDTLARHTLFVQAEVHNKRQFFQRVEEYFDPQRTGMLSLGFVGHTVQCSGSSDLWGWREQSDIISRVYKQVYHAECSRVLLSYKGQFIVSAARIRGIGRHVYEELEEALIDQNSWAHQEAYLNGRLDRMSDPIFGYTLERIWNILFQCSSSEVAWMCPTLLSGRRQGGSIEDCQCTDD